jgi:hypothetical protein
MDTHKRKFKEIFGELREDVNLIKYSSLLISYIQYLLFTSNSPKNISGFFDYGGIQTGSYDIFVWGINPIFPLKSEIKKIKDIIEELKIEKRNPPACVPFLILEAGAALKKKEELLDEISNIKNKWCPKLKEEKEKCNNSNACEQKMIDIIRNNPEILNFCGSIKSEDTLNVEGKPDIIFQQYLFDWLFNRLKPIVKNICGSPYPKYSNYTRGKYNQFDFPEHDLIFILETVQNKIIIINIEIKYGKNKKEIQLLRQHLWIKELFNGADVISISFAPIQTNKEFKNMVLNQISNEKKDIPFLLGKSLNIDEQIINCNGEFKLEDGGIAIDELINKSNLENNIKLHLDKLFNLINSKIV